MQNPKQSKKIFKPSNSEVSHLYRLLRVDWPSSEKLVIKLDALIFSFAYISGVEIESDVFMGIIEKAVRAYGKTVFNGTHKKYPDPVRICVFTDSLVTQVVELIKNESFKKSSVKNVVLNSTSTKALRANIYELLVSDNLQQVLTRSGHEKEILDASVTLCN